MGGALEARARRHREAAPALEQALSARAVNFAAAALAVVAGALLLALTLLVTLDVLGRLPGRLGEHRLGFTLPWTTEVTEYALYWMTFLGAPWVLKEGGHISIDILTQRLGPAARALLARVIALLGALITTILLYYAIAVLWKAVDEQTQIVRMLTVKEWWIYAPLPVCVLLMLAIFTGWLFHPPEERHALQEGP